MIYLDANASSRLRPNVSEYLRSAPQLYNASSVHSEGRIARAALREARQNILNLAKAPNAELVFTSSGTEACNLMIFGFLGEVSAGTKIVSSVIEHPAIKETLKSLKTADIIEAKPNQLGRIEINNICSLVDKDTALVNLMFINNETGTIQALNEITKSLRQSAYQGLIISDACQAFGKLNFDLSELFESGLDAISISGHKIGAPAGIGALIYNPNSSYCRRFWPQIFGGPQEKGFRAGSENLLGAICFGLAAKNLIETIDQENTQKLELADYFFDLLNSKIKGITRYGDTENWVGNTLLLGFESCLGGDLVAALDIEGVAISTGAACASGKQGVSDTVKAIEPDLQKQKQIIRISLDWDSNRRELEIAADILEMCVNRMRNRY